MLVVMDRDDAESMAGELLRAAIERRRETAREIPMVGFLIVPEGEASITESFDTRILPVPLYHTPSRDPMRQAFSSLARSYGALAAVVIYEGWSLDIPQDNPAEARRLLALHRNGVPVEKLPGSYESIVCMLEHPFGVMMWTAKIMDGAVTEPAAKWICADDVVRMEGPLVNLSGLIKVGAGAPARSDLKPVGEA